jgi:hypothetical protein
MLLLSILWCSQSGDDDHKNISQIWFDEKSEVLDVSP